MGVGGAGEGSSVGICVGAGYESFELGSAGGRPGTPEGRTQLFSEGGRSWGNSRAYGEVGEREESKPQRADPERTPGQAFRPQCLRKGRGGLEQGHGAEPPHIWVVRFDTGCEDAVPPAPSTGGADLSGPIFSVSDREPLEIVAMGGVNEASGDPSAARAAEIVNCNPGHGVHAFGSGEPQRVCHCCAKGGGKVAKDEHPATPRWPDREGKICQGGERFEHAWEVSLTDEGRDPIPEVSGSPSPETRPIEVGDSVQCVKHLVPKAGKGVGVGVPDKKLVQCPRRGRESA
jgi:hypothetical protein